MKIWPKKIVFGDTAQKEYLLCYDHQMVWQIFLFAVRQEGDSMLAELFEQRVGPPPTHNEEDLYKELTICGRMFRLLYGYYEDFERESRFNEPMPIYPDFIKDPLYTDEGIPFVTAMQNVCRHYSRKNDEDSSCSDCVFFQRSEDLFGFCNCPQNKRSYEERAAQKNK